MTFVNQHWFDRPAAHLEARGASARKPILGPNGETLGWVTNGGIANPVPTVLHPPERLVRFGQSGIPSVVVQGGWWLRYSEYLKAEQFADRRGVPVQVAIRLLCAVPLEWSVMDMVVQVRLKVPLLAYEGVGAPAIERHAHTSSFEVIDAAREGAGDPVAQLFIPGLGSGDVRHDALMLEGYGHLPPDQSRSGYFIRLS